MIEKKTGELTDRQAGLCIAVLLRAQAGLLALNGDTEYMRGVSAANIKIEELIREVACGDWPTPPRYTEPA